MTLRRFPGPRGRLFPLATTQMSWLCNTNLYSSGGRPAGREPNSDVRGFACLPVSSLFTQALCVSADTAPPISGASCGGQNGRFRSHARGAEPGGLALKPGKPRRLPPKHKTAWLADPEPRSHGNRPCRISSKPVLSPVEHQTCSGSPVRSRRTRTCLGLGGRQQGRRLLLRAPAMNPPVSPSLNSGWVWSL